MSLTPYIRTPLTDIGAYMFNHQQFGECAEMEMRTMDCLEAYGIIRGQEKCADLLSDFKECQTKTKQLQRIYEMRMERQRQIKAGILKGDEKYGPVPRLGSL